MTEYRPHSTLMLKDRRAANPQALKAVKKMSAATETTTVRVMLVDDHADFRRLMTYWIDREPDLEVGTQAKSLEEARRNALSVGWDVAVLDLGLPDGNGADLIAELREGCPGCAMLILSGSLDPTNLAKVREAGAEEVLEKVASPEDIIGAIRRLGNR